ncbi:hypothetical protein BBO_08766 [Beauveria brongniartii RCEF 3172]|uniref:Uncharacterized protein n=1 Tax=Beauveria brongniartii RCEF 3172 TaxID=1081107 RepID=A0A166RZW6_9HYPO|nr:hypothetical protein BBO_08766 [Beauveria brongniartii RCEF 3172]
MRQSSAAALLLGALQPAFAAPWPGEPELPRVLLDGTQNAIMSQFLTSTEFAINYYAPDPGCGSTKAWVGVWPIDACNPYHADYKAWSYVELTSGKDLSKVRFKAAEIGVGEFKAAFLCEDGRRQPWLVSEAFKIDAAPPARTGQCLYRKNTFEPEWTFTPCDKLAESVCYFCHSFRACETCAYCEQQCK